MLPREVAIERIKAAIEKSYGVQGSEVVRANFAAVDQALAHLFEVQVPGTATSAFERPPTVPPQAPRFVHDVTAQIMRGRGDDLRVSQLPVDGTFPPGTAAFEKRNISDEIAVWDPDICIQCGQCGFACPHSVIRAKYFHEDAAATAPKLFKDAPVNTRGNPDIRFALQVYLEDCTGCGICVEVCPALNPQEPGRKAINLGDKAPILSRPPANGRWNGLFAWDEGCGGKHGGKIEADSGCCGTGGIARPVEIGAARRSGPGAGDPADAGGAEGRGDCRSSRGARQHGAELAGLLRAWRGGGAAAAPEARTAGQDRAACRGDRRSDPERGHAPQRRLDPAALVRRDCPARRTGDLAAVALAPTAPKGFAWRRPRHTLKGRQDAAAVAASRQHLADLKTQAAAGAIDLVFLD